MSRGYSVILLTALMLVILAMLNPVSASIQTYLVLDRRGAICLSVETFLTDNTTFRFSLQR